MVNSRLAHATWDLFSKEKKSSDSLWSSGHANKIHLQPGIDKKYLWKEGVTGLAVIPWKKWGWADYKPDVRKHVEAPEKSEPELYWLCSPRCTCAHVCRVWGLLSAALGSVAQSTSGTFIACSSGCQFLSDILELVQTEWPGQRKGSKACQARKCWRNQGC